MPFINFSFKKIKGITRAANRALLLASLLPAGAAIARQADQSDSWPALKGDYLGQKVPGMTPELFAPDVISTKDGFELNSVFSPDGRTFMFSRRVGDSYKMFLTQQRDDGVWSKPRMAGPSKTFPGFHDADMAFSMDQKWLYFISTRPLPGYSLERMNIWRSRNGEFGLEPAEPLSGNINRADHELYPTLVADGSMYYSGNREDSLGGRDIYRAQYKDGKFGEPVNLGNAINSEHSEGDVYVTPDEQMLIFVGASREDTVGRGDLYISFRQADGSWSKSKHMGPEFNTDETDYCPVMSHDGKYFFFSRNGELYWVDSKALNAFRD